MLVMDLSLQIGCGLWVGGVLVPPAVCLPAGLLARPPARAWSGACSLHLSWLALCWDLLTTILVEAWILM
jgi:hypothetical protein